MATKKETHSEMSCKGAKMAKGMKDEKHKKEEMKSKGKKK